MMGRELATTSLTPQSVFNILASCGSFTNCKIMHKWSYGRPPSPSPETYAPDTDPAMRGVPSTLTALKAFLRPPDS